MRQIGVEMFRENEWVEAAKDVAPVVSVDEHGSIYVALEVGHVHPPWRVLVDGAVVFERAV